VSLRRSIRHGGLVITDSKQLAQLVLDEINRQGISKSRFGRMCGQSATTLANVFIRSSSGTSLNAALQWVDALHLRLTLDDEEMTDVVQACQLIDAHRVALGVHVRQYGEGEVRSWQRIRGLAQGKTEVHGSRILLGTIVTAADYLGRKVYLRTKPIVSKRDTRLAAIGVKPIVVSKLNKAP